VGSMTDGTSGFILFELGGKMGSFGKLATLPFPGPSSLILALRAWRNAVGRSRRGANLASRWLPIPL
jgi:hypothetical protein